MCAHEIEKTTMIMTIPHSTHFCVQWRLVGFSAYPLLRIYGFTSRNISDVKAILSNTYIRKDYGSKSLDFGELKLWEISPKIDNQQDV